MGLDVNECFDVQRNFYLGKRSVDSGSEEYFGTEGQESNEIAGITVMGLECTFSPEQHYDSTAAQTSSLMSLVKITAGNVAE